MYEVFIKCLPHHPVKKVVSDSPGLVDFAIGLVNSVLKMKFFGEFKLRKNCKSILLIKIFMGAS